MGSGTFDRMIVVVAAVFLIIQTQAYIRGGNFTKREADEPWLPSGRCGPDHPLPNGEPAQCNPHVSRNEVGPCCSDWGWCGPTSAHCNCEVCVDFRNNLTGSGYRATTLYGTAGTSSTYASATSGVSVLSASNFGIQDGGCPNQVPCKNRPGRWPRCCKQGLEGDCRSRRGCGRKY